MPTAALHYFGILRRKACIRIGSPHPAVPRSLTPTVRARAAQEGTKEDLGTHTERDTVRACHVGMGRTTMLHRQHPRHSLAALGSLLGALGPDLGWP